MMMTHKSHGNQQPSQPEGWKVQRLSPRGVEPSGSKRGASFRKDEDIVCSASKDAEGRKQRIRSQHKGLLDKTNNSLVDVVKRTAEGNQRLTELPAPDGDNVTLIDWGGVSFHQSTLVHQTPNFDGTTQTALRTYIIGRDGLIGVSFGAKENTQIGDGNWRNLQVWVRRITEPSGYDPSKMIGGFASYNCMYTATLPPDPVQRIRYIDAVSAVA
jgi:hypothetical protein